MDIKIILLIVAAILIWQKAEDFKPTDWALIILLVILLAPYVSKGALAEIREYFDEQKKQEQEEQQTRLSALDDADAQGRLQEISVYQGELKDSSEQSFMEGEVLLDVGKSRLNLQGRLVTLMMNSSGYKEMDAESKQQFLNEFKNEIRGTKKISEYHELSYGTFKYGIKSEKVRLKTAVEDGIAVCRMEIPEEAYTVAMNPEYNTVLYGRFVRENGLNTESTILLDLIYDLVLKVNGYIDRPIDKIGESSNKLLDLYQQLCQAWLEREGQVKFLKAITKNKTYQDFDKIIINGIEVSDREEFTNEELASIFGDLPDMKAVLSEETDENVTISVYYKNEEDGKILSIVNGLIAEVLDDPFETIKAIKREREDKLWVDQTLVPADEPDTTP